MLTIYYPLRRIDLLPQHTTLPHGETNHGIAHYDTFEAREIAFRQATYTIFPRLHLGSARFWQDFKQLWRQKEKFDKIRQLAIVTPNPGDGLVFGTPQQELAAAIGWRQGDIEAITTKVEAIAETFNLTAHLHQPLRTLSGGETVRLALAKAFAAIDWAAKLVMAAPYAWMDSQYHPLINRVTDVYQKKQIPTQVMALTGENDPEGISSSTMMGIDQNAPLQFKLVLKDVQIPLANLLERIGATPPMAALDNFEGTLISPCLLAGGNGQGKSLLAKVLAEATDFNGQASVTSRRKKTGARLIFQDVVTQGLLRPNKVIAQTGTTDADDLLDKLQGQFVDFFQQFNPSNLKNVSSKKDDSSLLTLKLMLVAVRLAHHPAALILDEPDWGFSRQHALAFVASVIKTAHAMGVAVLLISHKPWWRRTVPSILNVKKELFRRPKEDYLFRIHFKKEIHEG